MRQLEILFAITTPLALAALCLLLGTGLLRVVAKSKPSKNLTQAIHWGFILALILGVLANVSYLVLASFGREVRIAGTVRDSSDRLLSRAIVDIAGRGRGITDDYGAFELNIPDSRTADSYEVVISLEGYKSERVILTGPRPKTSVNVSLQKPQIRAEDFIHAPTNVYVRHYLGQPQIDLMLNLSSPLPYKATLEDISVEIVSPSGRVLPIQMEGTYSPASGQYIPVPLRTLTIDKGETFNLNYSFFNPSPGLNLLLGKAAVEFPPTSAAPEIGRKILSAALADEMRTFMASQLPWEPGEWTLRVGASLERKKYSRPFRFTLSKGDIDLLKNIGKYYEQGYGVLPMIKYWQFADASSSVQVLLQE